MKSFNARRKLEEARFFLTQLRQQVEKGNSLTFGYYLSAFLSAAFSVIWVARFENSIKDDRFDQWKKSLTLEEQELVEAMHDQRRWEIHQKGAEVVPKESNIVKEFYPLVQALPLGEMLRGTVEIAGSVVRVWIPKTEYHFVKRQGTAPVLSACTLYLRVLEKFMSWIEGSN